MDTSLIILALAVALLLKITTDLKTEIRGLQQVKRTQIELWHDLHVRLYELETK